ESREGAQRAEEGFLDRVLGVVRMAQDAATERVERPLVWLQQPRQGLLVAGSSCTEELRFCLRPGVDLNRNRPASARPPLPQRFQANHGVASLLPAVRPGMPGRLNAGSVGAA